MNEVVESSKISPLIDMDLRYWTSLLYLSCLDNCLLWARREVETGSKSLKDNRNLFILIIMRLRQQWKEERYSCLCRKVPS